MAGRWVTAGARAYEIIDDRIDVFQALIIGSVIDEATGTAPQSFTVRADDPSLLPSAHLGGAFCLAGDPDVALADHSVPHPVTITIDAEGFREQVLSVTVPINPGFPMTVPTVALRRNPNRIQGRTVALDTGNLIAGAAIVMLDTTPLPPPRHAVLFDTPLWRDHAAAISAQGQALMPVASPVPIKTVIADADAGASTLIFDDRQGLGPGQVLRIGAAGAYGFAEIATLAAQPGGVTLASPLVRSARSNDAAAPFALGALMGPAAKFVDTGFAGEGIVMLDAVPAGDVIVITDPAGVREYHNLGAISNAAGYYALDGITRLATLPLQASAAAFITAKTNWSVDWSRTPNLLDWRLHP
jgi:hypothetical protein